MDGLMENLHQSLASNETCVTAAHYFFYTLYGYLGCRGTLDELQAHLFAIKNGDLRLPPPKLGIIQNRSS